MCVRARVNIFYPLYSHIIIILYRPTRDLYVYEEIFFSLFFNKRLIVNHKFFAAVYMTRTPRLGNAVTGCRVVAVGSRRICEIVAHHFRPAAR